MLTRQRVSPYRAMGFVLASLACLFVFSVVKGQQVEVTGKVVGDNNSDPLPGVNVLIKGSNTGTATDIDGNFRINASSDATLVFSFIGYLTQEVTVGNQTSINITMVSDVQALEEIVVVGYGTVRKKDLTGAVSQIDAQKISHQSPNSITDILRSNIPGLNVGFSNSPKGVSQMEVRGKNTLNAGSSPLIVVDGIIYNGDLSDINPADIDKVDVMKDASSAAVYGARGANGVVLITTKRGTGNKPTISLNSSLGVATNGIIEKPYDPDGYAAWRTDVFKSIYKNHVDTPGIFDNPNNLPAGVTLSDWLAYDGATGDPTTAWLNRIGFQDVEIANYLAGKSVDWYDKIIRNGMRNDMSVSLSGNNEQLKYYWSIGRTNNEGVVVGDEFHTTRSRLNLEADVTKFLKVGINTQFANRDESAVPAEWGMITADSPWGSEFNDDGTLRLSPQDDSGAGARHPFLRMTYTDQLRKYNSLNSRLYANVKLPVGFSYEFAYTNRSEWNDFFRHQSDDSPEWGNANAFRENEKIQEWQLENILRWDKTIDEHTVNVTLLSYAEKYQGYFLHTGSSIFSPNDDLGFYNMGLGSSVSVNGIPNGGSFRGDQEGTGDALMGRVNYSFMSKYLLSLSVRRDGYSAFGTANKRATFPSAALGWVISEESFFRENMFDFLKLRFSLGANGNRNIGRYSNLSQLTAGKYLIVNPSGSLQTVSSLNNTTMENSSLKWESTNAWNIGVDFSIMDGVVEGTIDAYDMTTTNLLVERALPPIIGFTSVYTNLGELKNKGLELALTSRNLNNTNLLWTTNFNFSLNRNKLVSLYGDLGPDGKELDDPTNGWYIDHAIDHIFGAKTLGIYQTSQEDQADLYGVRPGDFILLDKNDDKKITRDDYEFLGYAKPRFRWTLVNNLHLFKNIDLSMEVYSHMGMIRAFNDAKNRNGFIDRTNSLQTPYWTPENPTEDWARLFSSDGGASFNVYRNNSFIRLQNITVSYTIPQAVVNKISAQSARIYGNIRNVGVFSPGWTVYDPEASEIDGTAGSQLTPRYFTIGLNLSL